MTASALPLLQPIFFEIGAEIAARAKQNTGFRARQEAPGHTQIPKISNLTTGGMLNDDLRFVFGLAKNKRVANST